MPFLPVVDRELRVAGRQPRTYWRRSGVGLVAIAVSGLGWLTSSGAPAATVGFDLFMAMSVIALIYCLFAGLLTSDSLSGEKREGTLGLLFLTDLRGYDVVLGKLVASALHAFFGLLALFPVLAIAFLLGGVSLQGLLQMVAVLLNALFFSLSAGMLMSAVSRHERKAAGGVILLVLFVTLGIPFLGWVDAVYRRQIQSGEPLDVFLIPSPIFSFYFGLDSMSTLGGKAPPFSKLFLWSLVAVQVQAWALLVLACLVVPRTWRDMPAETRFQGWRRFWNNWVFGNAVERLAYRRRLLDRNPICWLSSRERWKPPAAWATLILTVVGWSIGYYKLRSDWLMTPVAIVFAVLLHAIFKCWLATEVCRRFAEDRHSGALELLLSTPLSVRAIVGGQWLALRRVYGGPLVALLVIDVLLMLIAIRDPSVQGRDREAMTYTFVIGMTVLVADFVVLSLVGMWHSVSAKSYNRAVGLTMMQILIAPWLIFFAGSFVGAFLADQQGWQPRVLHFLAGWFILVMGINAVSAAWAGYQLYHKFRFMATQRFQPLELRGWRRWLLALGLSDR